MSFHEVRFPTAIGFGSTGGPRRRTVVVTAGSGFEHRNSQWSDSRREYDAGYGVKSISDIYSVVEFFEERRGKLYGFRWKDVFDHKSGDPSNPIALTDQTIGTGDGTNREFQLSKTYGSTFSPYTREITKPVSGTVLIGVNGALASPATYSLNETTGVVTFNTAPGNGAQITAGFEFDVPVRFDTDFLEIDLASFKAGNIPSIPVIELKL